MESSKQTQCKDHTPENSTPAEFEAAVGEITRGQHESKSKTCCQQANDGAVTFRTIEGDKGRYCFKKEIRRKIPLLMRTNTAVPEKILGAVKKYGLDTKELYTDLLELGQLKLCMLEMQVDPKSYKIVADSVQNASFNSLCQTGIGPIEFVDSEGNRAMTSNHARFHTFQTAICGYKWNKKALMESNSGVFLDFLKRFGSEMSIYATSENKVYHSMEEVENKINSLMNHDIYKENIVNPTSFDCKFQTLTWLDEISKEQYEEGLAAVHSEHEQLKTKIHGIPVFYARVVYTWLWIRTFYPPNNVVKCDLLDVLKYMIPLRYREKQMKCFQEMIELDAKMASIKRLDRKISEKEKNLVLRTIQKNESSLAEKDNQSSLADTENESSFGSGASTPCTESKQPTSSTLENSDKSVKKLNNKPKSVKEKIMNADEKKKKGADSLRKRLENAESEISRLRKKMQTTDEFRQREAERLKVAEDTALRYKERAEKTIDVEKRSKEKGDKLKKKDAEIAYLTETLSSQQHQSETIEKMKEQRKKREKIEKELRESKAQEVEKNLELQKVVTQLKKQAELNETKFVEQKEAIDEERSRRTSIAREKDEKIKKLEQEVINLTAAVQLKEIDQVQMNRRFQRVFHTQQREIAKLQEEIISLRRVLKATPTSTVHETHNSKAYQSTSESSSGPSTSSEAAFKDCESPVLPMSTTAPSLSSDVEPKITVNHIRKTKDVFEQKNFMELAEKRVEKLLSRNSDPEIKALVEEELNSLEVSIGRHLEILNMNIRILIIYDGDVTKLLTIPEDPKLSEKFERVYAEVVNSDCVICLEFMDLHGDVMKCNECQTICHTECLLGWFDKKKARLCTVCNRLMLDENEYPALR